MTFCKVMHKNNLKYAGELASLSIPQIILVYDAQRHIELFSCVSSGKHRKVQKSEMHDFVLQDCVRYEKARCMACSFTTTLYFHLQSAGISY